VRITTVLICSAFLAVSAAKSAPVLLIGTPGNSYAATPTGPLPNLGILANFDNLTAFSSLTSYSSPSLAVTSPDGFSVLPYSTQSGPNELFDSSPNGTANIAIKLPGGVSGIGVGIADGDPVSITLQALNSAGAGFGPVFSINLATTQDPNNVGNGYYALFDTTSDIFGLQILQTAGSPNYSGLAIDDVQATPEPVTSVLFFGGCLLIAVSRLRKRA